jgi:thiamine-phosphate pyrophosphorylase
MLTPSLSQAQLYRILDANLDRAREGIRVIEEWCRLGLEHQGQTQKCKDIRQILGKWHSPLIRSARDTAHDPGTELSHAGEEERPDLASLLAANFARVQEALRVLEEYGKLYDPALASEMKALRYQVYELQSALTTPDRLQILKDHPLYLVTMPHPRLLAVVEDCLQGGLKIVQFRQKEGTDREKIETAQALCKLCHAYDALFLVNDRVDIALVVGADGVHLGQTDMSVKQARQILGHAAIIGLSTTSPQELTYALEQQPDYVGVGPLFDTPTKPGKAAVKDSYLPYAVQNCPIPWFAIGGVNSENLGELIALGVKKVAVVRGLISAPDPKQTTLEMLQKLKTPA